MLIAANKRTCEVAGVKDEDVVAVLRVVVVKEGAEALLEQRERVLARVARVPHLRQVHDHALPHARRGNWRACSWNAR